MVFVTALNGEGGTVCNQNLANAGEPRSWLLNTDLGLREKGVPEEEAI